MARHRLFELCARPPEGRLVSWGGAGGGARVAIAPTISRRAGPVLRVPILSKGGSLW